MNVAIYVRVSTQEQKVHGISVDAQEAACRAWVAEHKHRIAGVYNDAGLSARAKYTKRRAMLQLLEDVRAGRIDLIIFTKLDRWFRNVADYYEVQAILEAGDVKWRAIQEDYETETASGRFKVNIMLAVAQDEADRTSERIKAAADYKRQKGEAVGRPALGYVIRDKHWTIDPETHDGMAAFFEAYDRTLSVREAMRAAAEYGITLNTTHAGRILRNPTYMGDAFGVPCPAYITPEQYRAHRERAGKRARKNKTGRVFLFTGLLYCGCCGSVMTSACMRKKDHEVKYYRCLRHYHTLYDCAEGAYANERKVEDFLRRELGGILDEYNVRVAARTEAKNTEKAVRAARGKLSRLKELYIDGDLTREDYDARSTALKAQLEELEQSASAQPQPIELPSDWTTTYDALPEEYKKIFWNKTIRRIIIRRGEPPEVVL